MEHFRLRNERLLDQAVQQFAFTIPTTIPNVCYVPLMS